MREQKMGENTKGSKCEKKRWEKIRRAVNERGKEWRKEH